MTPTETAALLRQFNAWRRDFDDKIRQPDPREIGEAIDAAIEMIDRLEAAEADALEQARLNGMGASREAALIAKLEAAEKERDDVAQQLVQSEIGKREISEAHNAVTRRLSVLADENTALRAKIAEMERQAPSVPDGWLRAIDEALVTAHIGVANAEDTYEQA